MRIRTALLTYAVRRGYAAFNRRDWEVNTLAFDHDRYEFVNGDPGRSPVGFPGRFVGVDQYVAEMQRWIEGWAELGLTVEADVIALPGDRVFTFQRWHGRAERSGITLDETAADVVEFDRGRIVRQTFWWDRQEAQRALGLQPHELRL